MSDFEDRLSRALTEGAEEAPGAAGLSGGARERRRRRSRTRGVVGVVAVVLAVAVPVALVDRAGPRAPQRPADIVTETETETADGWRTVEYHLDSPRPGAGEVTVLVDVPEAWGELADGQDDVCDFYDYGATTERCREVELMGVRDNAALDHVFGPGLRPARDFDHGVSADWIGYVSLDFVDVTVASDDQQVALRVLGSARLEGQTIPDLSGEWPLVVDQGIAYRTPAWGDEYDVQLTERGRADRYAYAEQVSPGLWVATATVGDQRLEARAPTEALAELVAGSAAVRD